jgi:hypothetical protein
MPRIKIDGNAHDILKRYKEELEDRKIEGADFSDALREMDRKVKQKDWDRTLPSSEDVE